MSVKEIIKAVFLFLITTAAALLADRHVSDAMAVAVICFGFIGLIWVHDPWKLAIRSASRKLVMRARRRRWMFGLPMAIVSGAVLGGLLFGIAWIVASRETPLPHVPGGNRGVAPWHPQPKPEENDHAAAPKRTASAGTHIQTSERAPESTPPGSPAVPAMETGNLAQRTNSLAKDIMTDLYMNGWDEGGKNPIPRNETRPMPSTADKKEYYGWMTRRSAYFKFRFLERVRQIRDEFAQLHLRDDRLDETLDIYHDRDEKGAPIPSTVNPISPLEIQEVANSLRGLVAQLPSSSPTTATSPPILSGVRIASQKQLPSDYPEFPYGLQVVLQTDVDISPVKVAVVCDGPVGQGDAGFEGGGGYMNFWWGKASGVNNVFLFKWDFPAWTPEKSIVVRIFSKSQIHAVGISRNVR